MRVIFLDMDGVLNSAGFFADTRGTKEQTNWASDEWWAQGVDPQAVRRLNAILDATGALVVFSSSWRYHVDPEQMQRVLELRGFRGRVLNRTPLTTELPESLRDGRRGTEILAWLTEHRGQIETFAILDDIGPESFPGLEDHLIKTSWAEGLQDNHVSRVVSVLQGLSPAPLS